MVDEIELPMSRRSFLKWTWRSLTLLIAGESTYLGLSFLGSRKSVSSTGQIVTAGFVTDFQPGTVTIFNTERFSLIRFHTGGFLALSSKCTHLACIVGWEPDQHVFACPCHGSVFNQDGSVATPPAPRPLDYFPIAIGGDGRIEVDTRRPIARSAVSGHELVYSSAQAAQATAEATAAW